MKLLRNSLVFLFIVVCGVVCFSRDASAANTKSQLIKFMKAVQKQDFKTIFDLTYSFQRGIQKIQEGNPKVLWDKLITKYYKLKKDEIFLGQIQKGRKEFLEERAIESIRMLIGLFAPPNRWKIIESRGDDFYVSINYQNVEESPLIDSKLFKETILDFSMNKDGLFISSDIVEEGTNYWERSPLKVLSVRWRADQLSGVFIEIIGMGGTSPYKSTLKCGDCIIDKIKHIRKGRVADDTIHISIDRDAWPGFMKCIEESPLPSKFIVTVEDREGATSAASFMVSEIFLGQCWVATPWRKWRQGLPHLCYQPFELTEEDSSEISMESKEAGFDKFPILIIKKDGTMYVDQNEASTRNLNSLLKKSLENTNDKKLYLKADLDLEYGNIVEIINIIANTTTKEIAIINEIEKDKILEVKIPRISMNISGITWAEGRLVAPVEIPESFQGFIVFTLFRNKVILVNNELIKSDMLHKFLKSVYEVNQTIPIFIRADSKVRFESVIKLIDIVSKVGFETIGIIKDYFTSEQTFYTKTKKANLIEKFKSETRNYYLKKWSKPETQKDAMKDISIIAGALADYITDNGITPKHDGIYDENSEIYKLVTPFYAIRLPIWDPWGNNYRVYCGTACNGKYGIANCDSDDFLIVSYGRDGKKEDWNFDASDPEAGIFFVNSVDDFDKDLVIWNGSFVRSPRSGGRIY